MIFSELREIQRQFGYLPPNNLRRWPPESTCHLYRLHGVASFYPHFRLTPPPKVDVRICQDMSCHLRGADELRDNLEKSATQSANSEVKIGGVSCLGRCDHAPAIAINEKILTGITAPQIHGMIGDLLSDVRLPPIPHAGHRVQCAI